MRTLVFDQFEFDNAGTEERLEIKTARRSEFPFPNFRSFVASLRLIGTFPDPKPFKDVGGFKGEAEYIRRFANIEVPEDCAWSCYELPTDHGQRHLLLETEDGFISYFWSTSA